MKIAESLADAYIGNFIRRKIKKLYINLIKINLKCKLYMVGFLCPPKVRAGQFKNICTSNITL